jgi:hypothetical protein
MISRFVVLLDDAMDANGCIAIPWWISVGLRHAVVEIWRGGWY